MSDNAAISTWSVVILASCCLTLPAVVSGQSDATFVAPRLVGGSLPLTPGPNVVARIEEFLQVGVDVTGGVTQMTPLRASPLPADLLMPAVRGWRFQPARNQAGIVPSRVLVAAIFRPPQLDNSPTLGNLAVDLVAASDEIPFPIVTETPVYPVIATGEGVVLVEVLVGVDGRGRQHRIATGGGGFDQAALDAAVRWSFRPARFNGRAVETYAYLLFGFRRPVVIGPPPPSPGD